MMPVIGLPRGRMQDPTYKFLKINGIEIEDYNPALDLRTYKIGARNATFVIDNSKDLARRVALGDVDIAILGGEAVAELTAEHEEAAKNRVDIFRHPPENLISARLLPICPGA